MKKAPKRNPADNRRYKLHYKLREKGNRVIVKEKEITLRCSEISKIEVKYCAELQRLNYSVMPPTFDNCFVRTKRKKAANSTALKQHLNNKKGE
jgi:hypothetical protein